jgi:hypothetical protein
MMYMGDSNVTPETGVLAELVEIAADSVSRQTTGYFSGSNDLSDESVMMAAGFESATNSAVRFAG